MRVAPTLGRLVSVSLVALALAACSGGGSSPPPQPQPPACLAIDVACTSGPQCCSGSCTLGTCDCSPLSARCASSADCCDAVASPRRCQTGACASGCRADGDVCTWNYDCCSSNCDGTGRCAPPCRVYASACTSSDQCCSGYGCPAGTCSGSCGWAGQGCTVPNDCCSGLGCRAGVCQTGACGTSGQHCHTVADCCGVAQGGKSYRCENAAIYGTCTLSQVGEACTTDADCDSTYPCRNGYCHYPDGSRALGTSCLDGPECASGICTSTTPGVWGTCCGGSGASCTASYTNRCCAPLACVGPTGAQTCGGCLGPDSSGAGKAYQCTTSTQCCSGASLACDATDGKCCKTSGAACATVSDCCTGDACANVTTYQGTQTACCHEYLGSCSPGVCCDGSRCSTVGTGSACLKGPGQACGADAECATGEGCRMPAPPTGTCCLHWAPCTAAAECCSGVCSGGYCQPAQPYGPCRDDGDCIRELNTSYAGPLCGANPSLAPLTCCPAPGQSCVSAGDCCEAGDDCLAPFNPTLPAGKACCRKIQQPCAQDFECCTGACSGVPGSRMCCAYVYMTDFVCAADADCCSVGTPNFARCDLAATPHARCCYIGGWNVGSANAALCCSGKVDPNGNCRP